MARAAAADPFAAILRGEPVAWASLQLAPADLVREAYRHGVVGLLQSRLARASTHDWPGEALERLKRAARQLAAEELLRRREIELVLAALAEAGVEPILVKGAALAYSVYHEPMERPRLDTDLLVSEDHADAAYQTLLAHEYIAPLQCGGELLFRQFSVHKIDAFGLNHALDVHWKISTQTIFSDILTYGEIAADAVAVEALGRHARAIAPLHALLLACIHPAMHHRNDEWLPWTYDVHLLSDGLTDSGWDRLAEVAIARRVAAIVCHQLARARDRLGTNVPERILSRLGSAGDEPSSAYLQDGRRWHHELASNMRGLAKWDDRRKLLTDVLLPGRAYMLARYGVPDGSVGTALLPALYLHRSLSGLWKIATRRK